MPRDHRQDARPDSARAALRAAIVLVAVMVGGAARGDAGVSAPGQDAATSCARRSLVSLTPPFAGYSSVDGVIYDAAPFSYELAALDRVGVRLKPSVIVYGGRVQGYGAFLSAPVYWGECSAPSGPHGAYLAPMVAVLVDRLPETRRAVRPGAEAGWAWSLGDTWQLSVGLWTTFRSAGFAGADGGFAIALGMRL